MNSQDRILIAGGGIGGLATALALAERGIASTVIDKATSFGEVGAGIQMGPNFLKALTFLGLADAVLARAFQPSALVMRDALDASDVVRVALGAPFAAHFGAPYALIYRPDLHHVLLDAARAAREIDLITECALTHLDQDPRGVTATTSHGTERWRAVIGADGLWSATRSYVLADGPPVVSGHIAYRAVLPRAAVPDDLWSPEVTLWAGPRTHLVHYPLRGGALFNLVAVFHSTDYAEGWDAAADPAALHAAFAGQRPEVLDLLARIDTWRMWVLCDRPPVKHWSKGRVTLLGDAAHPMLQYMAQGAAMATEDALCLARHLAAADDPAPAFEAYAAERYKRTARVQLTARFYGDIYHASGVARELRADMLGGKPPQAAWPGMAWLYGHDPC